MESQNQPKRQRVRISESFFQTEPLINMLNDRVPSVRFNGLKKLTGTRDKRYISILRTLSMDPDESVQAEAKKRLKPLELSYRRKFFFFQEKLKKHFENPAYKFGFAITCLRYSQTWVENKKLHDYFLRQALKYLNQLIRMYEPNPRYQYHRAKVFRELNEDKLAIEDFKHVLKQKPNHTGAILELINLLIKTKRPEKSLKLMNELKNKKLPKPIQKALEFWVTDPNH